MAAARQLVCVFQQQSKEGRFKCQQCMAWAAGARGRMWGGGGRRGTACGDDVTSAQTQLQASGTAHVVVRPCSQPRHTLLDEQLPARAGSTHCLHSITIRHPPLSHSYLGVLKATVVLWWAGSPPGMV